MRSNQVHIAVEQRANRYQICGLASKGVKITHKSGERMADSINRVLGMLRPPTPAPGLGQHLAHGAAPASV
jgi:hypothetical protein